MADEKNDYIPSFEETEIIPDDYVPSFDETESVDIATTEKKKSQPFYEQKPISEDIGGVSEIVSQSQSALPSVEPTGVSEPEFLTTEEQPLKEGKYFIKDMASDSVREFSRQDFENMLSDPSFSENIKQGKINIKIDDDTDMGFKVAQLLNPPPVSEVAPQQSPEDLSFWDSVNNTYDNIGTRLQGFIPRLNIVAADTWETVLGKELAQKWYGLENRDLEQVRAEAYSKLAELEKETKATRGVVESVMSADPAGFAAAVVDAVGALASTAAPSILTGGAGLFTEMVGDAIVDYNNTKAEQAGVSVDELYKTNQAEFGTPAFIGIIGGSMEKIGLKGVTKGITKNITGKNLQKVIQISKEVNKEGMTEWVQTGLEEANKVLAMGGSVADAGVAAGKKMASEEGLESYLKGTLGSAGAIGIGRATRGAISPLIVGKEGRAKAKEAEGKINALKQDVKNPEISNDVKATLSQTIKAAQNELLTLAEETRAKMQSLTKEMREEVVAINEEIAKRDLIISDPNVSEQSKEIVSGEIKKLESEAETLLKAEIKTPPTPEAETKTEGATKQEKSDESKTEGQRKEGEVLVPEVSAEGVTEVAPEGEIKAVSEPAKAVSEPVETEKTPAQKTKQEAKIEIPEGEVKKTVLTYRVYEGKAREEIKKELEKHGLTRERISQKERSEQADSLIEEYGEEAVLEIVKNGDIRGAAASAVIAKLAKRVDDQMAKLDATDTEKLSELGKKAAELINLLGQEAFYGGEFNSQLAYEYDNSDLGYNIEKKINDFKEEFGVIPVEIEAKFRDADKQMKELREKLAEAEKKIKILKEEQAIADIRESIERNRKRGVKSERPLKKGKDLIAEGADELAEALGFIQMAHGTKKPDVSKALAKIGRGLIDEGLATAENVMQKIKEYVDDKFSGKVEFEKYSKDVELQLKKLEEKTTGDGKIKISHSMIEEFVERGIDNINDLTIAVRDAIKEQSPNATEREVRDAITKYGKIANLNKDQLQVDIRKMKRVGIKISQIEDVRNKKRPLRSGLQRDKLDAEERALQKELKELMKDLPPEEGQLEKEWRSALDAIKTRLRNSIEDLERRIETGEKPPAKRQVEYDAEAKILKEERDKLKKIIEELEGKPEITDEQRVKIAARSLENSISELERRIREGELYPKKEESKTPETPELKALREQKDKLKEEIERLKKIQNPPKSPEQKATETAIKSTERRADELAKRIQNKELEVQKKQSLVQNSAELQAAKTRLEKQKEELRKLQEEAGIPEKAKLQAAKKRATERISELERRIKEGDFSKKPKKPIIVDTELIKLKADKIRIQEIYDKEFEKARLKNRTRREKWIDNIWDIWGITRLLQATGEFSFVGIQGLQQSVAHPIHAKEAFKIALQNFASERKSEKWLREIKSQEWYPELKQSKLAITEPNAKTTAREELFFSDYTNLVWDTIGFPIKLFSKKAFDKWTTLSPFKGFERAASGYLDTLRVLRFLDGKQMLEKNGITFNKNPEAYKQMADAINTMTGRASLGRAEQLSQSLTKVFFSPRNWASAIKTATPYALYHFGKMRAGAEGFKPSIAQKMAIGDFAKFIGATTSMVALAAAYFNNDDDDETGVEFDPTSSDFGKIKIGDTRIDPWGGRIQQVVLLSRFIADSVKKESGEIIPLGTRNKTPTKKELLIDMATNKLAPSASLLEKYLSTQTDSKGNKVTRYGDPYEFSEELKEKIYPIYWGTINELLKDDATALDGLLIFYAFFGGGVQTFEKREKKKKEPQKPKTPEEKAAQKLEFLKKRKEK